MLTMIQSEVCFNSPFEFPNLNRMIQSHKPPFGPFGFTRRGIYLLPNEGFNDAILRTVHEPLRKPVIDASPNGVQRSMRAIHRDPFRRTCKQGLLQWVGEGECLQAFEDRWVVRDDHRGLFCDRLGAHGRRKAIER